MRGKEVTGQQFRWQIGLATTDITPCEPIAMSGWAMPRISKDIENRIHAKFLAISDASGHKALLITCDLLGLSRRLSERQAESITHEFGLTRAQVVINSSHNHSGPQVDNLLHLYSELSAPENAAVDRYTTLLEEKIMAGARQAFSAMEPSHLCFSQGLAGFAVNRRRDAVSRGGLQEIRSRPQIVDQDVPVLSVKTPEGRLRAVVFGYACHPTVNLTETISGDWPGIAQAILEQTHPGTTAMFVAGCGGDQNALPRYGRFAKELPPIYGQLLAASVNNVLDNDMLPLRSDLYTSFQELNLKLCEPPTRAALLDRLQNASGVEKRALQYQLTTFERGELLHQSCPYPVHHWQLGDLRFIGLSGEPVVDYSLRFKEEFGTETTWTAGYCNELTAYIPSLRVLREGDYEGQSGMLEYGWPAAFAEDVEENIVASIKCLMNASLADRYEVAS